MIEPHYETMSEKYTNTLFLKVDVMELEDLADKYSVSSMPTFILFETGNYKPIATITGANKDKLEQLLDQHQ
jgi:thioredoxin 1